jgi:hypothetical protein
VSPAGNERIRYLAGQPAVPALTAGRQARGDSRVRASRAQASAGRHVSPCAAAYSTTNASSGTVLDSVNCGSFDGTLTDLWSPLGNNCQEWDVTQVGGHYTISNVANGMVLDAENCETANGTVVRQWAQLDNACQQWNISK